MCNYYEEDDRLEDFHARMRAISAYLEGRFEPLQMVRPTDSAPFVMQDEDGRRVCRSGRFGLVPVWSKDPKAVKSTMNARSETVAERPVWKRPFQRQRALVPATAFFEWPRDAEGNKRKTRIALQEKQPMMFAGLWDRWTGQEQELWSFAIVTTVPNGFMQTMHDRMPVILHPGEYDTWLDPSASLDSLRALMMPCPSDWLVGEAAWAAVAEPRKSGSV